MSHLQKIPVPPLLGARNVRLKIQPPGGATLGTHFRTHHVCMNCIKRRNFDTGLFAQKSKIRGPINSVAWCWKGAPGRIHHLPTRATRGSVLRINLWGERHLNRLFLSLNLYDQRLSDSGLLALRIVGLKLLRTIINWTDKIQELGYRRWPVTQADHGVCIMDSSL